MAALGVGAKLDFVDGEEVAADVGGHRLDRADPVLRPLADDALLARHQCGDGWPALRDDAVIDLARQKAQRQADHPGAVRQHPFDGMMGLAGIRRPEDRGDPRLRRHGRSPRCRRRSRLSPAAPALP